MHAYKHIYIHANLHAYIHTYMHTYTHIYIHTNMHAYIHTYMHTYTYIYIQTRMHAYIHAQIHACMWAHDACVYINALRPDRPQTPRIKRSMGGVTWIYSAYPHMFRGGWGWGTGIYDKFAEKFVEKVKELKVGSGLEAGVKQVKNNGISWKKRRKKLIPTFFFSRLYFGHVECRL